MQDETGITKVLRVSRCSDSRIFDLFYIFEKSNTNLPIQDMSNYLPGSPYRTQRRVWLDGSTFDQWLREPRAIDPAPIGESVMFFVDNAAGHSEAPHLTDVNLVFTQV